MPGLMNFWSFATTLSTMRRRFAQYLKLLVVLARALAREDVEAVDHFERHRVAHGEHVDGAHAVVEGDLSADYAEVLAAAAEGAREALVVVPFGVEGDVAEGLHHLLAVEQRRHGEAAPVLGDHEAADALVGMGVEAADVLQVGRRAEVDGVEPPLCEALPRDARPFLFLSLRGPPVCVEMFLITPANAG